MRLQGLGYELERGKHGQPEIKGYTKEYLEASSPRREQIKDHLREMGSCRTPDAGQRRAVIAGTGIRPTGLWPKRGRMNSATLTNPTASRNRPSPMPAIICSSVPPCWTGASFWKRHSIAAWEKQRMPTSGRSSHSGPRGASSAHSIMQARGNSTPPPPYFA